MEQIENEALISGDKLSSLRKQGSRLGRATVNQACLELGRKGVVFLQSGQVQQRSPALVAAQRCARI